MVQAVLAMRAQYGHEVHEASCDQCQRTQMQCVGLWLTRRCSTCGCGCCMNCTPLVIAECEQLDAGEPRPLRHVMLRRDQYEALQHGTGFIVFAPWHEVCGTILARNCERDP